MPTYVYKFVDTGETIEVQQAFTDDTLTEYTHPDTGAPMAVKKVFQPVGVTFKGNGFYKTDSRGGSAKRSGDGSSTGDSTSSDTSSTSSDATSKDSSSKDSGSKDTTASKDSPAKDSSSGSKAASSSTSSSSGSTPSSTSSGSGTSGG